MDAEQSSSTSRLRKAHDRLDFNAMLQVARHCACCQSALNIEALALWGFSPRPTP